MGWGKIKLDKADVLFSKYIRLRDRACQRCGKEGYGIEGITGLQNSHFFGRYNESTRYDPANTCALCAGCHQHFGANPHEYTEFMKKRLGESEYKLLCMRKLIPLKKDREMRYLEIKELMKTLNSPNRNFLAG